MVSRRAYKHYHDFVSFEATYLTNMYKMPCAPFIGINNHNLSLQLGCIRNEGMESYIWLFIMFLECMGSVSPFHT